MRSLACLKILILAITIMAASADFATAQPADMLDRYRMQRDAYVDGFRTTGQRDRQQLDALTRGLETLVQQSAGETRVRALAELGGAQRMGNDYRGAIATLSKAVEAADALGLQDVAFTAWIGIARAHAYGTSDHGAAAIAFERAVDAAGEQPTPKQSADLADYRAQLEIGRGELEAGIIDALQAIDLAGDPKDRFYAELDLADGLTKLVQSCDYRPLIDAKSSDDGSDLYAACRRAVAAAGMAYERAAATAAALGWRFMVGQTRNFQRRLGVRQQMIEGRARVEAQVAAVPFNPRTPTDVLVSKTFESGASLLGDTATLARLIDTVLSETDARSGVVDARSKYLRGLSADMQGKQPSEAAEYYAAAAAMLGTERRGYFDPRRRGTVIENRGETVESLALRLLSLGRESDAFAAFESVRARGLSELASVLALPDVTASERAWLADLLVLDARAGAIEQQIVTDLVANGKLDAPAARLGELERLRSARRAKLRANQPARVRFSADRPTPVASLDALRAAAARSGVPVLLYWTTFTNVIAWYVAADGSDVRAIFLPLRVLDEKVGRLLASSSASTSQFDETTARELFLYLLAPFAQRLNSAATRQIMIVPHGSLLRLPFEALIDPASGAAVIDRWAVSYAPNATMALAALEREGRPVKSVVAMVDPMIDINTGETAAIRASGVQLEATARDGLFAGAWRADGLHILTHGHFDSWEALLSSLDRTRSADAPILAAELVALPLRGVQLAVLSACQGGRVGTRISGELYGFPWVLLAGGATATVLSRWDVNGASNGQWMGVFYRELGRGVSIATAAAAAMREMRKQGIVHPFYWAAMQVSGR